MNILPHKLKPSKEAITSQSGLLALLQLMQSLGFAHCIDQYFPATKRKSGFPASLPKGFAFKALRTDAASYQQSIIEYCEQHNMTYAIRAKCPKISE